MSTLVLSRALAEKYPRNYLFKLETADTLILEAIVERHSSHAAAADTLCSRFSMVHFEVDIAELQAAVALAGHGPSASARWRERAAQLRGRLSMAGPSRVPSG